MSRVECVDCSVGSEGNEIPAFHHRVAYDRVQESIRFSGYMQEVGAKRCMDDMDTYMCESLGIQHYPYTSYQIERQGERVYLSTSTFGRLRDMVDPDARVSDWPDHIQRRDSLAYQRAKTEYGTIRQFEESGLLHNAQVGDSFFWASPSVYRILMDQDLSLDAKKEMLHTVGGGLSFHTNLFLFTVTETGELESRVFSGHLNPAGLRKLHAEVVGADVLSECHDDLNLDMHALGRIDKVSSTTPLTPDEIELRVKQLEQDPMCRVDYPKTPEEQEGLTFETMKGILERSRPYARHVYELYRQIDSHEISMQAFQELITSRFERWENSILKQIEGSSGENPILDISDDVIASIVRQELRELRGSMYSGMPDSDPVETTMPIDDPTVQQAIYLGAMDQYRPTIQLGMTGCGQGAGWGGDQLMSSPLSGFGMPTPLSSFIGLPPIGSTPTYEGVAAATGKAWKRMSSDMLSRFKLKAGVKKIECCGCPACGKTVTAYSDSKKIVCSSCKAYAP